MKHGRPDPRRAKIHRSYEVADIARLFDRSPQHREELAEDRTIAIEGVWPTLVLGAELRRFLTEKSGKRKQPTPPGQTLLYAVPRASTARLGYGGLHSAQPHGGRPQSHVSGLRIPGCSIVAVRLRDLARVMPGTSTCGPPACETTKAVVSPLRKP